MASHLPLRQGLGKDIGGHIVRGAVRDVDGAAGNDLANEMVSDVDVFSVVSRLCYFARTTLSATLTFSSISSCTILRPQNMTPRITRDSKSPMTDRLGPLVRPRFPVRYPIDSRTQPSPLWAYNTFSYVLFLSFGLISSLVPISSIPFCSTPFYCTSDLICFHSILFDSL